MLERFTLIPKSANYGIVINGYVGGDDAAKYNDFDDTHQEEPYYCDTCQGYIQV